MVQDTCLAIQHCHVNVLLMVFVLSIEFERSFIIHHIWLCNTNFVTVFCFSRASGFVIIKRISRCGMVGRKRNSTLLFCVDTHPIVSFACIIVVNRLEIF